MFTARYGLGLQVQFSLYIRLLRVRQSRWDVPCSLYSIKRWDVSRLCLKRDGTRAETKFRLSRYGLSLQVQFSLYIRLQRVRQSRWDVPCSLYGIKRWDVSRLCLKRDGTRAETKFHLSPK